MILCLHRVQWRSTRSVWMKVESMWASAPRMGRWDLSARRPGLLILGPAATTTKNQCFSSSIIHIKLLLSAFNVMLMMRGSRCFYLIHGHIFPMMHAFKRSLHLFWVVGERLELRWGVSHPSAMYVSMFSTLLLSCLFSSLPPSFMAFSQCRYAVWYHPVLTHSTLLAKMKISSHKQSGAHN